MSGAPASTFPDAALTEDAFLDGRVRLLQPTEGYRAATDPVLLAAATPAHPSERVLDVGCGVGAAALCLAARVPGLALFGIERQAAYATLSERNAAAAGAAWRVWTADVAAPPAELKAQTFDRVITNPPYYSRDAVPPAGSPEKDAAHRETVDLEAWLDFCLRRLRPGGGLSLIHRAERLADILRALDGRAGCVEICPLWPGGGRPAKRVVVRAVKESRAPLRLLSGLVLHAPGRDGFTPEADAVLRRGAGLALD